MIDDLHVSRASDSTENSSSPPFAELKQQSMSSVYHRLWLSQGRKLLSVHESQANPYPEKKGGDGKLGWAELKLSLSN